MHHYESVFEMISDDTCNSWTASNTHKTRNTSNSHTSFNLLTKYNCVNVYEFNAVSLDNATNKYF